MGLIVTYEEITVTGVDSGGEIMYSYEGQPLTGLIQEHMNNILIGESEYLNGHLGGIQREYYETGQIKEEYTIQFNKLEGSFKRWNENGILIRETIWEHGVCIQDSASGTL